MRSAFRGPAHQLAVRMRINNMAIIIIVAHATSHALCASNCTCAEGLHFSAFHYYTDQCTCQLSELLVVWFSCNEYYITQYNNCRRAVVYRFTGHFIILLHYHTTQYKECHHHQHSFLDSLDS